MWRLVYCSKVTAEILRKELLLYSRFVELVAKILGFSFKFLSYVSLSVMRQNGESQNDCVKKTKYSEFSENDDFLPPDTHTYVGFSENVACFVFLKHLFWDSPLCLITGEFSF